MAQRSPTIEARDDKTRHPPDLVRVAEHADAQSGTSFESGLGGGELAAQVMALQRFNGAQREALLQNIGRVQDNRHVWRLMMTYPGHAPSASCHQPSRARYHAGRSALTPYGKHLSASFGGPGLFLNIEVRQ